MIDQELLEILVCPDSKQQLKEAGADILDAVNRGISEGSLLNQGGKKVEDRIEEGLIRDDGKVLYPVRDDIPIMLIDEAILLDSLE